jgi:hypothetical protein
VETVLEIGGCSVSSSQEMALLEHLGSQTRDGAP